MIPPSAVIAFHNAPSDLDMMDVSLYRGQIIDTATDGDMRALARDELRRNPAKRDECPWKRDGDTYAWEK